MTIRGVILYFYIENERISDNEGGGVSALSKNVT